MLISIAWECIEKSESLHTIGKNISQYSHYANGMMAHQKVKNRTAIWSCISTIGYTNTVE